MQDMTIDGINGGSSDRFNFFGGVEYIFNEGRTMLSAWFAQLEDLYKQRYLEIRHIQPFGKDVSLSTSMPAPTTISRKRPGTDPPRLQSHGPRHSRHDLHESLH